MLKEATAGASSSIPSNYRQHFCLSNRRQEVLAIRVGAGIHNRLPKHMNAKIETRNDYAFQQLEWRAHVTMYSTPCAPRCVQCFWSMQHPGTAHVDVHP